MQSRVPSFALVGLFLWVELSALTGCGESQPEPAGHAGGASGGAGTGTGAGGHAGTSAATGGRDSASSAGAAGDGEGTAAHGGSPENAGHPGSGTAGTGASAGPGGAVSSDGASGASDGGAGAAGDAVAQSGADGGCNVPLHVTTPGTPTVELLVDTSSSMFESNPTAWSVLYDALMNPMDGVVHALDDKVRFGFLSYEGHPASAETDPACATMTAVAPALGNYAAIDEIYGTAWAAYNQSYTTPQLWTTPTNYAITYASNLLLADTFDGPKYVLLATDGNPNTCVAVDPQCGQDRAVKATQDAFAAGVGLLVLGVGDVVTQPNAGCPSSQRCGLLHLQDLANAGVGAGVLPPPGCDDPLAGTCHAKWETCNDGALIGSYTPGAPDVGKAFAVDTAGPSAASELITALSTLLDGVTSCSVELSSPLSVAPASVVVTIDGVARAYGGDNGWNLGADQRRITFQGSACTDFRNGGAVSVVVPCD